MITGTASFQDTALSPVVQFSWISYLRVPRYNSSARLLNLYVAIRKVLLHHEWLTFSASDVCWPSTVRSVDRRTPCCTPWRVQVVPGEKFNSLSLEARSESELFRKIHVFFQVYFRLKPRASPISTGKSRLTKARCGVIRHPDRVWAALGTSIMPSFCGASSSRFLCGVEH
ncbi:hypothetical protein CPB85DRAFT_1293478 [Mucidula mucida]|nr:hypothetical protein CPB85DRAFT_1293478 [Mucidula mucida]